MSHQEEKNINITIDKQHYHVAKGSMTGIEIKALGGVPNNYELFLEQPGTKEDRKIDDGELIELHSGMKFIGVPDHINLGR